ncbi:hypothetical protein [Flavobacterium subsaxonicum]|uniref:Glycosyltransferase RgtA/B/C/D-like domain-containing protein n=1 Tax=Flavobacterium subsaxonicum WB 4.1-42 = DSM 21790 TaxID=1121898 RepID=A0A0A2MJX7_9FLAO|nr:hypothetical protein [Flavobacterium subsaxonicum]KGO92584.1 hypothetical protein Q766_12480 [Flavobacterium subsaxonicum WB 4.1-42 = DSM 21790]
MKSFSTPLKRTLSLAIFLFINLLFAYKYISRVTEYALPIAMAIALAGFFMWKKKDSLTRFTSYLPYADIVILILFTLTCAFVFKKIPVESLNVDRWSVISSFWDNYFNNKYVYFAKSNMGNPPGPMPFYYIVALPFYLVGELGYFSLLGLFIFYIILKYSSIQKQNITIILLLLTTSTAFLWEVACRSNLFVNGTLVLASMIYFVKKQQLSSYWHYVISGILVGLCMSTRNVYAIPYLILFLYYLKIKQVSFINLVVMGCIAVAVIALTFVPFVIGYVEEFKVMNPFIVQGSFLLPFAYTLVFIGLSALCPLLCRDKNDVFFYSGLILFLVIAFYFMYHIVKSDFARAFHDSLADNSYFILCLPFLLYYLAKTSGEAK